MEGTRRSFFLLFLFAIAGCPFAGATTLARMSVAQMSRAAPVIVRARCAANTVRWEDGEIWTFTTFQVEESWKEAAAPRITVRLLGGRLRDITSTVSGVPHFRPGEEVVLFLERAPRETFSVVSWEQGTFRIRRDPHTGAETVTQDTASFPTFDTATRRFEATAVRDLSIRAFREQVKAALASGARSIP